MRSYCSRSCQSAVGQTPTTLGDLLAVVEPDLDAHALGRPVADVGEVVADGEALGRLARPSGAVPQLPVAFMSRPRSVPK